MGNTMDSAPDSSSKAAVIRDRESPDSHGLCPWSMWLKNLEDIYLSTLCSSEFLLWRCWCGKRHLTFSILREGQEGKS